MKTIFKIVLAAGILTQFAALGALAEQKAGENTSVNCPATSSKDSAKLDQANASSDPAAGNNSGSSAAK